MQEHAKTWPDGAMRALYALILGSEDDGAEELQHAIQEADSYKSSSPKAEIPDGDLLIGFCSGSG